mmetsp:Transcript_34011/g.37585  ORF Transcript_34011/g.37585 Transcript_34011/m.37585 type:complete len:361 (+) Transcript_34011:46-1128(+)
MMFLRPLLLLALLHEKQVNSFVVSPNQFLTFRSGTENNAGEESTTKVSENNVEEESTTKVVAQGGGHDIRSEVKDAAPKMDPEEMKLMGRFQKHQKNAAKLDWPTDVRTLIEYSTGFAVMSTNSKSDAGYPGGSVVGFAPDSNGEPLFIFSSMSSHTQDLNKDPKCSLTVTAKEFKGAADGRVNLMGTVEKLSDDELDTAREIYLKKHPGAFWVTFGDFTWYRLKVEKIRFVGGFARAGSVKAAEYKEASPDSISEVGMFIAQHMNDDHQSATIAMVASEIEGMDVSEAVITSVDSLGMYVKCSRTPKSSDQPQQFKLRIPFPRPAEDRKDVKNIIVQMTQSAAAAANKKEAVTADKEES